MRKKEDFQVFEKDPSTVFTAFLERLKAGDEPSKEWFERFKAVMLEVILGLLPPALRTQEHAEEVFSHLLLVAVNKKDQFDYDDAFPVGQYLKGLIRGYTAERWTHEVASYDKGEDTKDRETTLAEMCVSARKVFPTSRSVMEGDGPYYYEPHTTSRATSSRRHRAAARRFWSLARLLFTKEEIQAYQLSLAIMEGSFGAKAFLRKAQESWYPIAFKAYVALFYSCLEDASHPAIGGSFTAKVGALAKFMEALLSYCDRDSALIILSCLDGPSLNRLVEFFGGDKLKIPYRTRPIVDEKQEMPPVLATLVGGMLASIEESIKTASEKITNINDGSSLLVAVSALREAALALEKTLDRYYKGGRGAKKVPVVYLKKQKKGEKQNA